ncbi:hypothetical protein RFI_04127 [Reticulomyxa filosa]|uniref:Glycerophosphocholine acyltransferase 1 n=1 Tax=Reticulomyxa filosa TaxID=46433 RepID=X6P367_RETFI|nr:hypothetical protein RFI_04127 [Reticulomyxa filosa]|eukprot:ETO32980.1 hypothetical protein RFI_04127 [Reticulomyxa filosa]
MILLTKPQLSKKKKKNGYFKWYYLVMLFALLTVRVLQYYPKGWHYFMFDFCYYVNGLALIHMFICPQNTELFQMIFVFANGPVLLAIVVWRNSMVFHSVDKMTSLFIHCFPPLYTFSHEWLDPTTSRSQLRDSSSLTWGVRDDLSFRGWIVWPTIFYWIWQCLYLWKTEYMDKEYLSTHSNITTSMRWFVNDHNNFLNKFATKLCRKLHLLSPIEKFDASNLKTKIIFVLFNFIYFLVWVLPSSFFHFLFK